MGVERGRATQAVPAHQRERRGHGRRPSSSPSSSSSTSSSSDAATVARPAGPPPPAPSDGDGSTRPDVGAGGRSLRRALPRLRNPARRRRGTIRVTTGSVAPAGTQLRGNPERALGLAGVLLTLGALAWAVFADGGAIPVSALAAVGLGLAVVDSVAWRRSGDLDLAVRENERLPAVPWGLLVGPAGALALTSALLAGAFVMAVLAGAAVVAALPGLFARIPSSALTFRATAHARRIRAFVRSHGAAEGDSVPGYLSPVGSVGARLVVFGPDGAWGDLMLRPDEIDEVARLARVELADEHDPSIARELRIGPSLWTVMNRSW